MKIIQPINLCIKTFYILPWASVTFSAIDLKLTFYLTWNTPRSSQFWTLICCEQLCECCCLV